MRLPVFIILDSLANYRGILVGFFEFLWRWAAIRAIRRQQVMDVVWVPWTKADHLGLARYINPQAKLWIELPVKRYELLRTRSPNERRRLVIAIYESLLKSRISYAENAYSADLYRQRIRSPIETAGVGTREGTCLDLAVLFAGICIGYDLLPIIVLLGDLKEDGAGHAIVLVSISNDLDQWRKRREQRRIENPVTDLSVITGLLEGRIVCAGSDEGAGGMYLPIECTGFAHCVAVGGNGVESKPRSLGQDHLVFDEAIEFGKAHFGNERTRQLKIAIDVASAHFLHGMTPFQLPPPPRKWWVPYLAYLIIATMVLIALFVIWRWKAAADRADTLATGITSPQTPLRALPDWATQVRSEGSSVLQGVQTVLTARLNIYLTQRISVSDTTSSDTPPLQDQQVHEVAVRAALALYHIGDTSGLLRLLDSGDQRYHPEGRSLAIWYSAPARVHLKDIHDLLKREDLHPSARQGAILSLGGYQDEQLKTEIGLERTLYELFKNDDDPGVHAATEWLVVGTGKLGERASNEMQQARSVLGKQGVGRLLIKGNMRKRRHWYVHGSTGITFVYLPGKHQYLMGNRDPQEREPIGVGAIGSPTQHGVTIDRPLLVSMTEVTDEQYQKIQDSTQHPQLVAEHSGKAKKLSWTDAVACCNRLADLDGFTPGYKKTAQQNRLRPDPDQLKGDAYRLPTEAEWEYACRGLSTARYCFGDSPRMLDRYAEYLSPERTQMVVGSKLPNEYGIFDCHGGVWEWCNDCPSRYQAAPGGEYQNDKLSFRDDVAYRVVRGGAANSLDWLILANYTRHAFAYLNTECGFRVVRTCYSFLPSPMP